MLAKSDARGQKLARTPVMGIASMLLMAVSVQTVAAERVNLIALLAGGAEFEGKEIYVSGYVCEEPGSRNGLFLTMADCRDSNTDNAILVVPLGEVLAKREGRLTVQGVYSRDDTIATGNNQPWGKITATTFN